MEDINDKIGLLIFHSDEENPHIVIAAPNICRNCSADICMTVCPSGVFKRNYQNEDNPIIVQYKQCIECGTCRLVCPYTNIEFKYPNGGYGVCFNDGVSLYPVPAKS